MKPGDLPSSRAPALGRSPVNLGPAAIEPRTFGVPLCPLQRDNDHGPRPVPHQGDNLEQANCVGTLPAGLGPWRWNADTFARLGGEGWGLLFGEKKKQKFVSPLWPAGPRTGLEDRPRPRDLGELPICNRDRDSVRGRVTRDLLMAEASVQLTTSRKTDHLGDPYCQPCC